jgi:hypothetical protein
MTEEIAAVVHCSITIYSYERRSIISVTAGMTGKKRLREKKNLPTFY